MNTSDNILDKKEFLGVLDQMVKSKRFTSNHSDYVMRKGEELIDFFLELEQNALLKPLQDISEERIKNILLNMDDMNKFISTLVKLYETDKDDEKSRKAFFIYDKKGDEYPIELTQFLIMWGWGYCCLCEVMREILTELIVFRSKPTGIGQIKDKFKEQTLFFNDVNSRLRNSFFHFNFQLKGGKIYYNDNEAPLNVPDLGNISTDVDLLNFVLMGVATSYINRLKRKASP